MKIKGFIIVGILLILLGAGTCIYASTKDGFELTKAYEDLNLEEKAATFEEEIVSLFYNGSAEQLDIVYNTKEVTEFIYYESDYIKYKTNYNESSKTLSIEKDYKNHWFGGWYIGNFGRTPKCTLKLAPSIKNLYIELNAGTVSINELDVEVLEFELNAGTFDFKDSKADKMRIELNAGTMNLSNIEIGTANVKVNAGTLNYYGKILIGLDAIVNAGSANVTLTQKSDEFIVNGHGSGNIYIRYEVNAGSFNLATN